MTWKAIILTFIVLALLAFARIHPWIFGASIAGFVVLIWTAHKLDKAAGIR